MFITSSEQRTKYCRILRRIAAPALSMPDPAKRESSTSIRYSPAERMATMNQLDQKYLQSHCLALIASYGLLINVDQCLGVAIGHTPQQGETC